MTTALNFSYRGQPFTADEYHEHFQDEWELVEHYWDIKPGQFVIDVGCAAGRYTIPALLAGAERVVGIDPNPHYLDGLERIAAANHLSAHLTVLEIAVGDGTRPDELIRMIEADERNAELSPNGARFTTLDHAYILGALHWIKIDVEGQELKVLQGAEKLISRHHPTLWVEDHSRVYPQLGTTHHQALLDWLDRHTYNTQLVSYDIPPPGVPRDYLLCTHH